MRTLAGLALTVFAGCSEFGATAPDASVGFQYTVQIAWGSAETPDLETVLLDGVEITSVYTFTRTFPSLADATLSSYAIDALTTHGRLAFQIVPSLCGGYCQLKTDVHDQSCEGMSSEEDDYEFFHDSIYEMPPDPRLLFGADEGSCYINNQNVLWEE